LETHAKHGCWISNKPYLAWSSAEDNLSCLLVDNLYAQFSSSLPIRQDDQSTEGRSNKRKRRFALGAEGDEQTKNVEPMVVIRVGPNIVANNQIQNIRFHGPAQEA